MRCVVGDDGIDGAILQAGDAGCAVFFRADRRVDFIPCFKSAQGFIGQDEVLRRDFCRNLDAALLGLADQFDSVLGADVSDVDRRVCRFGQENIACDGNVFGDSRTAFDAQFIGNDAFMHVAAFDEALFFAVVDDDLVEHAGIFHGFAHEIAVFNVTAVIGESGDAFFGHGAHSGQFLALEAFGDGADDFDFDFGFPFDFILHAVDDDCRIDDRLGIRHGRNAGDAAGSSCLRPRFNRFLAGLAGLAEMDVHIDEARCYDEARCVEDFGAVSAQIGSNFLNFTIFNENVTNFILLHGRIYDSAAFNE